MAVETVAEVLGRTKRSVQGKLTTLGAYVVPEKVAKPKRDDGPTKGEIQTEISDMGFNVEGFEAATKPALIYLRDYVAAVKASETAEASE